VPSSLPGYRSAPADQPAPLAAEEARYWDGVGAEARGSSWEILWRRHSDAVNAAWLAPRLEPRCGRLLKTDLFDEALTAGLYPLLAARAREVVGIDLAASTRRAAGERHPGLGIAGADVRTLPFADGVFDCVVSNSTLDHFAAADHISSSLCELHRVLRPGGRLLLTLDNLANPLLALRNALPFRPLHALGLLPYQIGVSCTPGALARRVRAAGFEVLERGAILHCPRAVAVGAARLLARRVTAGGQQRFLDLLSACERLAVWPTRSLTGHFIAIVARRP